MPDAQDIELGIDSSGGITHLEPLHEKHLQHIYAAAIAGKRHAGAAISRGNPARAELANYDSRGGGQRTGGAIQISCKGSHGIKHPQVESQNGRG